MLFLFGGLSGILSAACYIPYIRDILLLKTKPERASWLIWSLLGGIAFFSQLEKGATDSLWLTGIQTLGVLLVFILSIRYGMGGFTKKDYTAVVVAIIGLICWYFTSEAATALIIVILVDMAGGILTMIKSYKDPGSETLITWVLSCMAGFFAIVSVGLWEPMLLIYPFYIFLINLGVIIAIQLGFKSIREHDKLVERHEV